MTKGSTTGFGERSVNQREVPVIQGGALLLEKVISMEMWRARKKLEELRQMYEYVVSERAPEKRMSGKVLQFRARECGENVGI